MNNKTKRYNIHISPIKGILMRKSIKILLAIIFLSVSLESNITSGKDTEGIAVIIPVIIIASMGKVIVFVIFIDELTRSKNKKTF